MGIPTIPAAVFLPAIYGAELGLAAAGIALLIARATDVITDPLVGALSDRWFSRWGRRKPWILIGAIIGGFALLHLFQPHPGVSVGELMMWSILVYLGWTMINIPYTAWGAELSGDYHQRSRITSAREGVTLLGILAAAVVPLVAADLGYTEREALAGISWTAILLGGPFMLVLLLLVPDPLPLRRVTAPFSVTGTWRAFVALRDNKPFMRLLTAWFINGLANGIPSSLFLIYLEHGLHADQRQRGILVLVYFLSAVVAIPLWLALSKRVGKHRTWCVAMALTCVAFAFVPLLGPGDIVAFAAISIVTGMGMGADLSMPAALQADVIDYDTLRHGQPRAGLFFALWGMATKLALALAVGLAFPTLSAFGFDTDGNNSVVALTALSVIYASLPVVFKSTAIALVWSFPITAPRQRIIRKRLDRRDVLAAQRSGS